MISCKNFFVEDKLFREGYASTGAKRAQQCKDKEFVTHDWIEPTFDAADIIRLKTVSLRFNLQKTG